jgi:ribonuclease VapC
MFMSSVNAGEIWYILAGEISEAKSDGAVTDVTGLGIELIGVDWPITRLAETFKARSRMSYADCFAAALAKDRKSDLVTGDKEFKQVEGEVSIRWL